MFIVITSNSGKRKDRESITAEKWWGIVLEKEEKRVQNVGRG